MIIERFHDNGSLKSRSYCLDDKTTFHRLDGPALEAWYECGDLDVQLWMRHGKLHRLDGPAYYSLWRNGNIFKCEYWINGKQYSKEEFDEYTEGLKSKEDKELLGDLGQSFD